MNEQGRETLRRAAQAAWDDAQERLDWAAKARERLHEAEAQAEAALMRREALVEAVREVEPEWQPPAAAEAVAWEATPAEVAKALGWLHGRDWRPEPGEE